MKKLVSFVLAMMMVCTLCTVAFADDPYTYFEGEDAELFHIANVDCATLDDDTNAIHMQYLAQHFVPAESDLSGIRLRLIYGDGIGVMHFELRKGGANGEALFTKDVEFAAQGNRKAWYDFDFGETVTVTPGEKYALSFWLVSKTSTSFCIAVGSFECKEGLDLWRYKRFETDYSGKRFEAENVTLKTTGYTIGFELLTPVKTAAMAVETMISALPSKITLAHEEDIAACVAAYDALSDDSKALVTNLDKLDAALAALEAAKEQAAKDSEEATKVEAQINALPDADAITLADETAVLEAKTAFDGLTAAQKALVSQDAKNKLDAAMSVVQMVLDTKEAEKVEALLSALPTPTDVTLDDIEAILDAATALDALTDAQKALVDPVLVEKLSQISAVMEEWDRYNMGDVNADGKVDAKDALIALKITVNKVTPAYIEGVVADVDQNGKVDAKDALEMLKFAVDKPSVLDEYYTPVM